MARPRAARGRRAPHAAALSPRLKILGSPIALAAARRASSAAPCKASLSKRAATMEREWQEESLEAGKWRQSTGSRGRR